MGRFGNEKKVYSFLREINDYERGLLEKLVDFSRQVQKIIKTYEISKKEFCEKVQIKPNRYNDFVCGAYNYDMKSIILVEHLWRDKMKEEVDKKQIVKVAKEYGIKSKRLNEE
jgi:hypothetical protein